MPDEQEKEPSATSTPPKGVHVPVESIYGDNEQVEVIHEEKQETIKPDKENSTNTQPENQEKTIKIGIVAILGILLFIIGAVSTIAFIAGKKIQKSNTIDISNDQKGETDNTTNSTNNPPKTGFIPDRGYFRRDSSYTGSELVGLRAGKAKKNIIWITSDPDNDTILTTLVARKNETSLPVFILCGKETDQARLKKATDYGIVPTQLDAELETPYSFVLIDGERLIDISREHWVWETKEKEILKTTRKWVTEIRKKQDEENTKFQK